MSAASEEDKIKAILDAAAQPCPSTGPSFSDPTKFCFKDRNGIGFGTMTASEEDLRLRWAKAEEFRRADFEKHLRADGPAQLDNQFKYWVLDAKGGR